MKVAKSETRTWLYGGKRIYVGLAYYVDTSKNAPTAYRFSHFRTCVDSTDIDRKYITIREEFNKVSSPKDGNALLVVIVSPFRNRGVTKFAVDNLRVASFGSD